MSSIPRPGDRFVRTRAGYTHGQRTSDITVTVTVFEIVRNYTDSWTGETHAYGVRYELHDSGLGTSHHTQALETFRNTWM